MTAGTLFPVVDRVCDGRLAQLLTLWREQKLSYEAIAKKLLTEHGVDVSGQTVSRWCRRLEAAE